MPDYAAVMVMSPCSGDWELMSDMGNVIVFDTERMAWEWLPLLGCGRPYALDVRQRSITFLEMSAELPNRAKIVSPYSPGESYPWKRHVIWSEWWG